MFKKDCYHCSHIRPKKDNLCSIFRKKIIDINKFCCSEFQIDIHIQRLEEMASEQSDDEGSSQFFRLFSFKPFLVLA